MINEIELYHNILDESSIVLSNKYQRFVWKCHKIIELMNDLDENCDKKILRNALIIINSLFNNYSPDCINSGSIKLEKLSKIERENLIRVLEKEILS
ncbi:MAG: hypothetical protein ACFFAH_01955 [Promethearchaeota archaeon]